MNFAKFAILLAGLSLLPGARADSSCASKVKSILDAGVPWDLLNDLGNKSASQKVENIGRTATIVDFSRPSNAKRMHTIDLSTGRVESHLSTHGQGNDPQNTKMATVFSDKISSRSIALGLYLVKNPVKTNSRKNTGSFLPVIGLEQSNKNAQQRNISVMGCYYVLEKNLAAGRSIGSFCMDPGIYKKTEKKLANTFLYAGVSKHEAANEAELDKNTGLCALLASGKKSSSNEEETPKEQNTSGE